VDIIETTPYEWVKQVQEGQIKGIGLSGASTAGYRALFFNVTDPPFDNKKLRQAVAHAINKKEILAAGYFGFGEPVDQKYPKGHIWHVDGLPSPNYDPALARKLLKEAGYNGETIEMRIEQGADVEAMATVIQAQLKKIGMNVAIRPIEYGARRDQIRRGDTTFDIVGSDYYADPYTTYRQELACEPNPKVRSGNWTGYCNKERDTLYEKLETEANPQKRKALLKQLLTMDTETYALIPLGFAPRFFTFRDHVKGFATDEQGAFIWPEGGLLKAWLDK
jgi:peptide/nickel transport system substrate-binding protein